MGQENQVQIFTCGKATFKNISKQNKEIIQKSIEIQTILKEKNWWILDGDYQKCNWKEFFSSMSECSAQKLNLFRNNRVQIISQIQHVQYSTLKLLHLYQNKINNIQSLSFIHFEYLQWLGLAQNQINQIKCLKKLSTPQLDYVYLHRNPIIEINTLTRSKINCKRFRLILQLIYAHNPINQDLSVIVKLSSKQIERFQISSNKRIIQVKVQSMLKLRFPSIQIQLN